MTTTTDKTHDEAAATARDEIQRLKAQAQEALERELTAIGEAAGRDEAQAVSLRLKRRNILDELVGAAAWLAGDLVDVLHKIAAGADPHAVMGSDLPSRIREAEIRLEMLRELSR